MGESGRPRQTHILEIAAFKSCFRYFEKELISKEEINSFLLYVMHVNENMH